MSQLGAFLGWGLLGMVLGMAGLWALHRRLANAGLVDVGWAFGLALLGVFYGLFGNGYGPRRALLAGMVAFWGLRLALHLLFDRILGKPEDRRYQALREAWKTGLEWKLFLFFQAQGVLCVILSLPFLLVCLNQVPEIGLLEWAGAGLWLAALLGESLADTQLKAFKAKPANQGKTCRAGLWNYSRHPNYFFEWLIWIAYALVAWPAPRGWLGLISPVLMYYFLTRVTGIAMTEAHALKTRGDDYRDYQRTTNAFVPWFKRR